MTVSPTPKGFQTPKRWPFDPVEEECDRCGAITRYRQAAGWFDVWRGTNQNKRGDRLIISVCSSNCLAAFAVELNRKERSKDA